MHENGGSGGGEKAAICHSCVVWLQQMNGVRQMAGTLYLIATPIGNLEDMTYRAVRLLGEVDLIAAEDTRNSIKLLNHFDIKTPMTSYHEHNKYEKAQVLVGKLLEGMNIGKLHLAFAQKGTDDRRGHIDAVELECVIANYLHVHLTSIAHIIIEGFLTVATEAMVVTDKE